MYPDDALALLLYSAVPVLLAGTERRHGEIRWDEMRNPNKDTPEEIVEGCFKAQEKIISGYKGNEKTDWRKFQEAQRPKQVAISLTGEPTLYEPLGDLIELFHQKGLTTFLGYKRNVALEAFQS